MPCCFVYLNSVRESVNHTCNFKQEFLCYKKLIVSQKFHKLSYTCYTLLKRNEIISQRQVINAKNFLIKDFTK